MILADAIGTVIHTLDGGKLFVGSFLLLALLVRVLHHMQFNRASCLQAKNFCSSSVNLLFI